MRVAIVPSTVSPSVKGKYSQFLQLFLTGRLHSAAFLLPTCSNLSMTFLKFPGLEAIVTRLWLSHVSPAPSSYWCRHCPAREDITFGLGLSWRPTDRLLWLVAWHEVLFFCYLTSIVSIRKNLAVVTENSILWLPLPLKCLWDQVFTKSDFWH